MSDITAVPLYRHPNMAFLDKLMNLLFWFISPLGRIPKDETVTALVRGRKRLDGMCIQGFEAAFTVKKGWKQTALKVPRGDGTNLEIVLVMRIEKRETMLDPIILYFHGGAYTIGSHRDTAIAAAPYGCAAGTCTKHGARAVYACVNYRLAPEHRAPAAADDCERAFTFIQSNAELAQTHGYDRTRIHIWGSSAGAGHALVLGSALCRRGEKHKIASVHLDCPMVHPPCDLPSFTRNGKASWLAPAAWIRWAWTVYLGVSTPEELAAALKDPRVCPHTAHGGLDGMDGLPVMLAVCLAVWERHRRKHPYP